MPDSGPSGLPNNIFSLAVFDWVEGDCDDDDNKVPPVRFLLRRNIFTV
jgi:hypothetical protein